MAHLTKEDIEALISEIREYKGDELLEKLRHNFPLSTDLPVQEDLCRLILELLQAGGFEVPMDALTQPRLTLVNIVKGKQPLEGLMQGLPEPVDLCEEESCDVASLVVHRLCSLGAHL